MKKKTLISLVIGIVIALLIFARSIIDFVIEVMWFQEVGYTDVYFKGFFTTLKIMIPMAVILFVLIWLYYKSIKKSINKMKVVVEVGNSKVEKIIFITVDVILSLFISLTFAKNYWYKILEFVNSSDFNIKDPIFNMDISFFIFKIPLIDSLHNSLMFLIIMLIVITMIVFFTSTSKDMFTGETDFKSTINKKNLNIFKSKFTKFFGTQLIILSVLFVLLIGISYLLKAWNLVYSPRGEVFGASYTDVNITLKFYFVIAAASVVTAIVILISIFKSKVKPIVISVIILFVMIISESITAGVVQRFFVESNGIALEKPYIEKNIQYTKQGFNLDNIDTVQYKIENDLTAADIDNNKDIIENIKINSFKPTLEFYNQFQYIKKYYTFKDVDVDRYMINDKYTQVFIAPREMDVNSIDNSSNEWQNNHLIYTHGYGVVMNKVNSVKPSGQPDFVMENIPVDNSTNIQLENPRIYFGENTDDYVIVNTNLEELDYPIGDKNVKNQYDGEAGIRMNFLNKVMFAINKGNTKFLLSNDITSDSKILLNRNIMTRVQKIAPFLRYDSDPYLVINEGKLKWVIDAYTASNRYPFSEPINDINYVRNSVKVIIDAVDGTVDFYIVDENDPIIKTYSKIFPTLFKTLDSVSEDMKNHFRYPSDLFTLQSKVLEKYHVEDPRIFISKEDLWEMARDQYSVEGEENQAEPNYMVMKLPGEENVEMVILKYFNVKDRDNMVGMLAARMDGENYGQLKLLKFPVDETIYSPMLFMKKINQDTEISKVVSLWDKQGSEVVYGDTLIIPIKNSLLYVEPMYLRAQGERSIPEMKRIVMSYDDKIVLASSIEDGLSQLFNITEKDKTDEVIDEKDNSKDNGLDFKDSDIVKKANELYDKAIEAQKAGKWAEYGDYIDDLGKILKELSE